MVHKRQGPQGSAKRMIHVVHHERTKVKATQTDNQLQCSCQQPRTF
jgi:hypothetical protein